MNSDAGQVDTWVTLAEAAALLGKSEKTLRRWIAAGDLDKEAVRREETVGGFRYLLRRDAVEKLVGAKARRGMGNLDSMGAALSTRLDTQAAQLERIASMIVTYSQGTAVQVDKAVQELQELQEQQAEALGTLRELVEAQAAQLQELRTELQAERERGGWWRRLFGRWP